MSAGRGWHLVSLPSVFKTCNVEAQTAASCRIAKATKSCMRCFPFEGWLRAVSEWHQTPRTILGFASYPCVFRNLFAVLCECWQLRPRIFTLLLRKASHYACHQPWFAPAAIAPRIVDGVELVERHRRCWKHTPQATRALCLLHGNLQSRFHFL